MPWSGSADGDVRVHWHPQRAGGGSMRCKSLVDSALKLDNGRTHRRRDRTSHPVLHPVTLGRWRFLPWTFPYCATRTLSRWRVRDI